MIKQAHKRIIGERTVPNAQKILSAHEPNVNVIARGKAGRDVDFGNTWFIAESPQGRILDWESHRQPAPAEWRQLAQSAERQTDFDLSAPLAAAGADRGFCSRQGAPELAQYEIYNAVCPRNPQTLRQRLGEARFVGLQRGRGSTEARVAIFKQRQKRRLRSRGFDHRYLAIAWGVLGHNLWIVARLFTAQQKIIDSPASGVAFLNRTSVISSVTTANERTWDRL